MRLGALSERYESNGDPGAYSNNPNDKGGPSYGLYQLALNTGSLQAYVRSSCFNSILKLHPLGSAGFTEAWKSLAKSNKDKFAEDQHRFHMSVYYTPVRTYCTKLGIPDTNAINQVMWSTSTQQGPGWTKKVFKALAGKTERELIEAIYQLRGAQFMNSEYYNANIQRKKIRDSVIKRYKSELKEALELI